MAQQYLMTWRAAGRRWIKQYKGVFYAVSCRQLGIKPDTREASAEAANAWWTAKLRELEETPPALSEQELQANAFRVWSMVQDWQRLDEASRARFVTAILGPGHYPAQQENAPEPDPERTMRAQVQAWLGGLEEACRAGQISAGRWDAYRRNIDRFVEFVGGDALLATINEEAVEGYFTQLTVQVGAGRCAPSYAQTLLMTARQFIAHAAAEGRIPVPSNLRARHLRFALPNAEGKVFTVAEVQALLRACEDFSERTKLFLLLMLNCGMVQADIADLRKTEVDWQAGTIARAASRTRGRSGVVVTYPLWPETFALLRQHQAAEGDLVLTTSAGKPLVFQGLPGAGLSRYDAIQATWSRLVARLPKPRLGLSGLRRTATAALAAHPEFRHCAGHYAGGSQVTRQRGHAVPPTESDFRAALAWLRTQFLV